MAATLTVKIKDPDKFGEYLIIDESSFNEDEHELFDEDEAPQFAAEDSAGPARISPATIVGDNEVVLPRVPHPEGLVPPAEDGKAVPPKAKIGEVVGYEAGQVVREAGDAANMVGALDATFGAVPKEEAFKVSIPEQEPGGAPGETQIGAPVGTLADREDASEEVSKQKQEGALDPETASRAELLEYAERHEIEVGDSIRTDHLRHKVQESLGGEQPS